MPSKERTAFTVPGPVMILVALLMTGLAIRLIVWSILPVARNEATAPAWGRLIAGLLLVLVAGVVWSGFSVVLPNGSRVVTFFGYYVGTIKRNGWFWTVPLTARKSFSLRIQNFDSAKLKVNDAVGNPVEIGAVIVWRVVDTARAAFDVANYKDFVKVQTETSIRHVANAYPYDNYEEDEKTLRANTEDVAADLQTDLQEHLVQAGVEVLGTRITHLAYAPEIAADMLRRQQASAVVAARFRIVEGAVGMVQEALQMLSDQGVVELDEEKRAAMVSNLMVVLCSEHHAQPVLNAGSLYQ